MIVKGGQRVCGAGAALGNAPLVQSKSYFEVKIQQGGTWSIGLATRQTDLSLTQGMLQNVKFRNSFTGNILLKKIFVH